MSSRENSPAEITYPDGSTRVISFDEFMNIKAIRVTDHAHNIILYYEYAYDVIQSSEYMMNEMRRGGDSQRSTVQDQTNELMQIPEVRAKIAEMMTAHWDGWVDSEIPALGGKTPRSAVKTRDGRESVEALLLMAERNAKQDTNMGEPELRAIDEVRRVLGLKKD